MEIKKSDFVGSFLRTDQCPTERLPEFAFIGRSNVGKSSLINMLCQKSDLAKVSGTPGKTQMLNFFKIDSNWFMVDLPGYGYARVSRTSRVAWERMIGHYLTNRHNLQYVFVLIDAMIPPQDIDIEFINKLGEKQIPFVLLFTKTDRLKVDDRKRNVQKFNDKLLEYWETLPPQYITSSERKVGRIEILTFIEAAIAEFKKMKFQ